MLPLAGPQLKVQQQHLTFRVAASTTGEACLALPKLNLQFLTFHDYLLRNFNLFRLEATYEVPSVHAWDLQSPVAAQLGAWCHC